MKTNVKKHKRKTKRKLTLVRNHTRKCPGGKIRSQGLGRGLGIGQGKGPIGIPVGNRPKGMGTLWKGPKAIHGPRLMPPQRFKRMWISQAGWTRDKYFTEKEQKKLKTFVKKQGIKLPKGFPKTTRVKVGITKQGKIRPQSFLTPLKKNYGFLFDIKPRKKKKGYILMPLQSGNKPYLTKKEKEEFEIE